jgi:hypothetical protein
MTARLVQELPLASREIVPAHHGMAVREQAVYEIAADEAGSAGHENALKHEKLKALSLFFWR